jgi:hypothetical protein
MVKICALPGCGKPVERPNQTYCSRQHRQLAYTHEKRRHQHAGEAESPSEVVEDQTMPGNAPASLKLAAMAKEIATGRLSDLNVHDIKPLPEPVYADTLRHGRVKLNFVAVMQEINGLAYRVTLGGIVLIPSSTNPELHACRVLDRLGHKGAIGFRRPHRDQIDSVVLDIAAMAATT